MSDIDKLIKISYILFFICFSLTLCLIAYTCLSDKDACKDVGEATQQEDDSVEPHYFFNPYKGFRPGWHFR